MPNTNTKAKPTRKKNKITIISLISKLAGLTPHLKKKMLNFPLDYPTNAKRKKEKSATWTSVRKKTQPQKF